MNNAELIKRAEEWLDPEAMGKAGSYGLVKGLLTALKSLQDKVIILPVGSEPELGDVLQIGDRWSDCGFAIYGRKDGEIGIKTVEYGCDSFAVFVPGKSRIIQRNGKPVIYNPSTKEITNE